MVYQYNALYIPLTSFQRGDSEVIPGVRIINSSDYPDLIRYTPSLQHENWGDFFSETRPLDLAYKIVKIFEERGYSNIITGIEGFLDGINSFSEEDSSSYIINGGKKRGVTLHFPQLYASEEDLRNAKLIYELTSMEIIPRLFTDKSLYTGGSYRKLVENLFQEVQRLKDSIKVDKETPEVESVDPQQIQEELF